MDKTTILIVEDEADIREGIRIMLSGEGYRVLEAPNGYQALRMMNDDIDLVILDVLMPGMSGFQVCEELRKEYNAPILFLTALAQERDKLTGLTAGGDDYLIKPFSFSELIARVKALLRRYHVYQGRQPFVRHWFSSCSWLLWKAQLNFLIQSPCIYQSTKN